MAMTMEIGMALNDLDIGLTVVVALGAITYTDKYQLINNGALRMKSQNSQIKRSTFNPSRRQIQDFLIV